MEPRETGFTGTTKIPLYHVSYGPADAERLVVLHGGPGAHHDYLLPQMLRLAGKRQLLFYDQRGGGRSRDESREEITWETHVDDLAALVAEFRMEPLTLVGYSWGALLALLYCARANQGSPAPGENGAGDQRFPLPRRLVLIDPAPASRIFRKELEQEFAKRQSDPRLLERRQELMQSGLQERDPELYRRKLFDLSVAGYFARPDRAAELTPFRVIGRVQKSVWDSLGEFDVLPQLEGIRVPTLVVHGRDDPVPLQSSIQISNVLEGRLLVLESCGHVPYVEQPEALFTTVETFLDTYPIE